LRWAFRRAATGFGEDLGLRFVDDRRGFGLKKGRRFDGVAVE
jgi:hypothetical protein